MASCDARKSVLSTCCSALVISSAFCVLTQFSCHVSYAVVFSSSFSATASCSESRFARPSACRASLTASTLPCTEALAASISSWVRSVARATPAASSSCAADEAICLARSMSTFAFSEPRVADCRRSCFFFFLSSAPVPYGAHPKDGAHGAQHFIGGPSCLQDEMVRKMSMAKGTATAPTLITRSSMAGQARAGRIGRSWPKPEAARSPIYHCGEGWPRRGWPKSESACDEHAAAPTLAQRIIATARTSGMVELSAMLICRARAARESCACVSEPRKGKADRLTAGWLLGGSNRRRAERGGRRTSLGTMNMVMRMSTSGNDSKAMRGDCGSSKPLTPVMQAPRPARLGQSAPRQAISAP